jgi:hypothetical protein
VVQSPIGSRDFHLLHGVQNVSVSHPASYPMVTGSSIPRGKVRHEGYHSPPYTADVRNIGAILPSLNGLVLNYLIIDPSIYPSMLLPLGAHGIRKLFISPFNFLI